MGWEAAVEPETTVLASAVSSGPGLEEDLRAPRASAALDSSALRSDVLAARHSEGKVFLGHRRNSH
eukprot:scaffold3939_cov166-Amphora_coffeaeformis.AAC.18